MAALIDAFEAHGHVPDGLRAESFALRPLRATDAERDYDAVVETRDDLRAWEQTGWPADDFTVEENRRDVVDLEARHDARRAFTYTVTDPADTHALGCVYVFPTTATFLARAAIAPLTPHRWDDVDAVVYFWMRRSAAALESDLVTTLCGWFAADWAATATVFVTSTLVDRQVAVLQRAGLEPRFELREPGKDAPYVAFG